MKISNTAPLHLSNQEVLSHFLSLKEDNDQLAESINHKKARDKAFARAKYPLEKDDSADQDPSLLEPIAGEQEKVLNVAERRGLSDELVWVQNEVIKYLCQSYNPTSRQTADGVARLADELQDHDLTKAEVLQIANLAPTEVVELYAIIEEPDMRFLPDAAEKLQEIATQIQSTLLPSPPDNLSQWTGRSAPAEGQAEVYEHGYVDQNEEEMHAMGIDEQEYIFEGGRDGEGGVDDEKDESMD
ncbi:uncharacterized protein I303_103975 [Kwoniella dejecticola CBS 10117]|uniref:DNA-directed RNA polymerase III subunit RPC9 n=1 Tax=Kwoniella dejecticola CBS 10117 TaxID=1296121 RepID=A0A1A6A885_9TREE|nr:uncharacterized protein I303_03992 [Kwoniella dejecticola CBS 10117]OBR86270.1 hypothetical protein I303_03992 [Kwoniella dejecticola CBS 10117]